MFGNGKVDTHESRSDVIYKTLRFRYTEKGENSANKGAPASWKDPNGNEVTIESATYYSADGSSSWDTAASVEGTEGDWIYMTFPVKTTGSTIEVSANTFPSTYYVTGDTFARSDVTGRDEFFQFIIPKAKVNSENTITLEAEGDPSVNKTIGTELNAEVKAA